MAKKISPKLLNKVLADLNLTQQQALEEGLILDRLKKGAGNVARRAAGAAAVPIANAAQKIANRGNKQVDNEVAANGVLLVAPNNGGFVGIKDLDPNADNTNILNVYAKQGYTAATPQQRKQAMGQPITIIASERAEGNLKDTTLQSLADIGKLVQTQSSELNKKPVVTSTDSANVYANINQTVKKGIVNARTAAGMDTPGEAPAMDVKPPVPEHIVVPRNTTTNYNGKTYRWLSSDSGKTPSQWAEVDPATGQNKKGWPNTQEQEALTQQAKQEITSASATSAATAAATPVQQKQLATEYNTKKAELDKALKNYETLGRGLPRRQAQPNIDKLKSDLARISQEFTNKGLGGTPGLSAQQGPLTNNLTATAHEFQSLADRSPQQNGDSKMTTGLDNTVDAGTGPRQNWSPEQGQWETDKMKIRPLSKEEVDRLSPEQYKQYAQDFAKARENGYLTAGAGNFSVPFDPKLPPPPVPDRSATPEQWQAWRAEMKRRHLIASRNYGPFTFLEADN